MIKQSKQVLIAEDDTFLTNIMGKVFKQHGIRVVLVNNGQEALEALKREVPDVLLLDLLMPVLDGFGVMKAMKEKHVQCPIVVVSNVGDKVTRDKCKAFHVKAYLVKSDMDDDALWPAIEKYLK